MFTLWTVTLVIGSVATSVIKEDARMRGMENQFTYFSNPTLMC